MSIILQLIKEEYSVEDINTILIHKEKLTPRERAEEWYRVQLKKPEVREYLISDLQEKLVSSSNLNLI